MDVRFATGIRLFNAQSFFEAHDVWEELWKEASGDERLFYQGLIQTAAGFYHFVNRNYRGASSQLSKAIAKLELYLPVHAGVETSHFLEQVLAWRQEADRLQQGVRRESDLGVLPRIVLRNHDDRLNEQIREGH